MSGDRDDGGRVAQRAPRRAARQVVGEYHEQQLRDLLDRVRNGFAQLDRGEIDPFELDDLIHHYKRAAQKLWTFCGSSGADWERTANALAFMREKGESHDWWDAAARPKR